jgi:hypothetical protein
MDHSPPHFHAEYAEFELIIAINPIKIIKGEAPRRVKSMVLEWAALHQEELLLDWEMCKTMRQPVAIEPLD